MSVKKAPTCGGCGRVVSVHTRRGLIFTGADGTPRHPLCQRPDLWPRVLSRGAENGHVYGERVRVTVEIDYAFTNGNEKNEALGMVMDLLERETNEHCRGSGGGYAWRLIGLEPIEAQEDYRQIRSAVDAMDDAEDEIVESEGT